MSASYFLVFAAVFLGVSAGAVALVRRIVVSFSGIKPLLVSAGLSVITAAVAYGIVYFSDSLFTAYCLLAGLFLVSGIIHMLLQQRNFTGGSQKIHRLFFGKLTYALSVLFFTLIVFAALLYFTHSQLNYFLPAFLGGLTFFLPLLIAQAYFLARRIPEAEFTSWTYPPPGVIKDFEDDGKVRLVVIAIELTKNPEDSRRTNFRAKMPEHYVFGDIFYHFINDYNDEQSETPIEVEDDMRQSYDWLFRRRTKWFLPDVVLDPTQTLAQNGVMENSIIVCERQNPDFQY